MEPTRQFLVMVDGPVTESELLALVISQLPGSEPYRRGSALIRRNLLEINPNEAADPELAATDEEDYLYFGWRMEFTPSDGGVDEEHQIALARDVVRILGDAKLRAVVCAAFEDRV